MRTLTDEQKSELENREKYKALKAELLKEYKSYAKDLEYAEDTFDEGQILEKRETLAKQIKSLGAKLREIEAMETLA